MTSKDNLIEILLVEDNLGDVELTLNAFESCHVRNKLSVVNDGEDALDYLYKRGKFTSATTPDVILLDLNLPKQNGQEVLEIVKNDPDLKKIPVVILTSSASERDIVKSYNLHANSYIIKPVDVEKFLDVVRSIENFWLQIVKLPSEVLKFKKAS